MKQKYQKKERYVYKNARIAHRKKWPKNTKRCINYPYRSFKHSNWWHHKV